MRSALEEEDGAIARKGDSEGRERDDDSDDDDDDDDDESDDDDHEDDESDDIGDKGALPVVDDGV